MKGLKINNGFTNAMKFRKVSSCIHSSEWDDGYWYDRKLRGYVVYIKDEGVSSLIGVYPTALEANEAYYDELRRLWDTKYCVRYKETLGEVR